MFDKFVARLSSLTPNEYFFRFVTVCLLIAILASQFPWMGKLLGKLLNFPELWHQVSLSISSENDLDSASLTVANLGFGAAKNVLIHVNAQHCHVVRYQVDSQELYQIKTADLESGVLDVWLDRLASGASVRIELTGTGFVTDTILLSTASDQGISTPTDSPTFSDQVDAYTRKITGVLSEAGGIIWTSTSVQEIRDSASTKPIFAQVLQVVSSHEFQTVVLGTLIVVFLTKIFLPYKCFVWGVPLITGFITWLFFDFGTIPTPWVIVVITIISLISLLASISAVDTAGDADISATLMMLSSVLGIGCLAVWWYWYDTVSVRWILGILTSLITLIVSTKSSSE